MSQYLLSVSPTGKLTLTPITISAVAQPASTSSSHETSTPCATPVLSNEHQDQLLPSTAGPSTNATFQSPLIQSPEELLQTPVSFSGPISFSPQDILPLPQVAQSGPRVTKPNKRLGASRCLTSSPEMKRIREQFDEKQRKEKQAENRKKSSVAKTSKQSTLKEVNRIFQYHGS